MYIFIPVAHKRVPTLIQIVPCTSDLHSPCVAQSVCMSPRWNDPEIQRELFRTKCNLSFGVLTSNSADVVAKYTEYAYTIAEATMMRFCGKKVASPS